MFIMAFLCRIKLLLLFFYVSYCPGPGAVVECQIANEASTQSSSDAASSIQQIPNNPKNGTGVSTTPSSDIDVVIENEGKTTNLSSATVSEITPSTPTPTPPPSTTTTTTVVTGLMTSTTARPVDINCLPLKLMGEMDHLTQEEFTSKLTDSCRYDRLIKPVTPETLKVDMQIDLTHIESSEAQMKAYILVQLGYKDNRLKFDTFSPKRGSIQGEEPLRNKIWVPHLIVRNERESSLMGLDGKDVFVEIMPDGEVIYSYRMTLTFYCWMNLKKFPFDYQICEITWISWAYDASNMILKWSTQDPVQISKNLHLTEFVLDSFWTETYNLPASFSTGGLEERICYLEHVRKHLKNRRETEVFTQGIIIVVVVIILGFILCFSL